MLARLRNLIKTMKEDPTYLDRKIFCKFSSFSESEYIKYHFSDKRVNRHSFISYKECEKIFPRYNKTILNKKETYLLLKEFYSHDCLLIDSKNDCKVQYEEFISKHTEFFIKAFNGAAGKGIRKVDKEKEQLTYEQFVKEYPEGCLLEETIKQSDCLGKLHPQSVNTLRITTVNINNHIDVIYPVLSIGIGDSIFDNSRNGNIRCAIDLTTSKITQAFNNEGKKLTNHPDTGITLEGYVIPSIDQAIELAKDIAAIFPDNVFTGFDFAHTDKGWILVEANTETRFGIWQLPYQKGFRKDLISVNKRLTTLGNYGLVSVILPTYNGEKYIGETIESVINQSYKHWELIIIDDGSTDSTTQIIDKYRLKDKRIRIIRTNNAGVVKARNVGLNATKGKFFMFLDHDDLLNKNSLINLLKGIGNADICFGGYEFFDGQSKQFTFKDCVADSKEDIKRDFLSLFNQGILWTCWKVLYKTSAVKTRFAEGSNCADLDTLFVASALSSVSKISVIRNVVYSHRVGNVLSLGHKKLGYHPYWAGLTSQKFIECSSGKEEEKIMIDSYYIKCVIRFFKDIFDNNLNSKEQDKLLDECFEENYFNSLLPKQYALNPKDMSLWSVIITKDKELIRKAFNNI